MDDTEAFAVLLALSDPLEWRELDSLRHYWQSFSPIRENRQYHFTLTPLKNDAVRFDKDGAPLTWFLRVTLLKTGGVKDVIFSCGLPVSSFDSSKAACARLALSGDFMEMEAMEKRWYTLQWDRAGTFEDGLPRGTEGTSAAVVRQEGSGCYTALAKKQWWGKYFTARYTVQFPQGDLAEPLSRYLKRQKLRPPSLSLRRYKTQEEARTACERHHATGKWE